MVLILMGILSAIAIPTYLALEGQNNDQAAALNLVTAEVAVRGLAGQVGQNGSSYEYPSDLLTDLSLPQPLSETSSASTGPDSISIYLVSSSQLLMAAQSLSGRCVVIYDTTGGLVTWGLSAGTNGTCEASLMEGLLSSITGTENNPECIALTSSQSCTTAPTTTSSKKAGYNYSTWL